MIKRITYIPAIIARPSSNGFSLVELLIVIAITSILAFLALPTLQSLQKSSGFTKSVYELADNVNYARSYALSEDTYVYVGLTEVDRMQNPSTTPQAAGFGRVVMGTVASKDGTNLDGVAYNSANLIQVRPPTMLDMLYLAPTLPTATTGGMVRPSSNVSNIKGGSSVFTMPFSLPLGTALNAGKYNFTSAIPFNPQGEITVNGSAVQWIEIDLQPYLGSAVPPPPASATQGNQAALIIDGATGALSVFRP